MEKDILSLRYGTHYKAIKRIGSYPLSQELLLYSLGETEDMKAITQRCYSDMKKDNLKISVIDYLCWISAEYLYDMALTNSPKNLIGYFKNNFDKFKEESVNMLRYVSRRPEKFVKWGDVKELLSIWYDNYMKSIKSKG